MLFAAGGLAGDRSERRYDPGLRLHGLSPHPQRIEAECELRRRWRHDPDSVLAAARHRSSLRPLSFVRPRLRRRRNSARPDARKRSGRPGRCSAGRQQQGRIVVRNRRDFNQLLRVRSLGWSLDTRASRRRQERLGSHYAAMVWGHQWPVVALGGCPTDAERSRLLPTVPQSPRWLGRFKLGPSAQSWLKVGSSKLTRGLARMVSRASALEDGYGETTGHAVTCSTSWTAPDGIVTSCPVTMSEIVMPDLSMDLNSPQTTVVDVVTRLSEV